MGGPRLQPSVIETAGGTQAVGAVHRHTLLQFVHDKLINEPVGVWKPEKSVEQPWRGYLRLAEGVERHLIKGVWQV